MESAYSESNEEAAELLGVAYKRIGDKETTSELQQQLLLLLSPKRFAFCASQIAAEIVALEEGVQAGSQWDAAAASGGFPLQEWLQRRDLCSEETDIAAATLDQRRQIIVELLTELLCVRHERGQALSLSLSLSRAPQQQQLQQQLQQTVSSLCEALSVPLPSNPNQQQIAAAVQQAAAAVERQPPSSVSSLLLGPWPSSVSSEETAAAAELLRDLCKGLNEDYQLRRRVMLIRANVALQAFLYAVQTAEHEEAVCKVLESVHALEKAEPPPVCLHSPFAAGCSLLSSLYTYKPNSKREGGSRSWVRGRQLVSGGPPCAGGKVTDLNERALRDSIQKANAAMRGKGFSGKSQGHGFSGGHYRGGGPRAQEGAGKRGPQQQQQQQQQQYYQQQHPQQQRGGGHGRYRRGRTSGPDSAPAGRGGFGGRAGDLPPTWRPSL